MQMIAPISIPFLFLAANVVVLLFILWHNKRFPQHLKATSVEAVTDRIDLNVSDVLGWEFEYARTTASEAMQDRHSMINYYLLLVGISGSGVAAVLGKDIEQRQISNLSAIMGTVILWLLSSIGWFYFLIIIRLRQAWYDSVSAMNQIKDFYIQHANLVEPHVLQRAFRWKTHGLPAPAKAWTVYFYAAILVGFVNSIAYTLGSALVLISLSATPPGAWMPGVLVVVMGLGLFVFHVRLYFAFLTPRRQGEGEIKVAEPQRGDLSMEKSGTAS